MNWLKRKRGARRPSATRTGRLQTKPSVLQNQRVSPRVRKKGLAPKVDTAPAVRVPSRRRESPGQPFMVRALEKGLILAAGAVLVFKHVRVTLRTWMDKGRETVQRLRPPPEDRGTPPADDPLIPVDRKTWTAAVDPPAQRPAATAEEKPQTVTGPVAGPHEPERLEPAGFDTESHAEPAGFDESTDFVAPMDGRVEPELDLDPDPDPLAGLKAAGLGTAAESDDPLVQPSREDVEIFKMTTLEVEEEGLPEEELEDQAGALRSMLSNISNKS